MNINISSENQLNDTIYSLLEPAYYENIKLKLNQIKFKNSGDKEINYIITNIQAGKLLLDITQYGYSFTNSPTESNLIFQPLKDHIAKYEYNLDCIKQAYGNEDWITEFSTLVEQYICEHKNYISNLVEYCKKKSIDNDLFKELPLVVTEDLTHYQVNSISDAYSISSYDRNIYQFRRSIEYDYGNLFIVGSDKEGVFYKIDNGSHLLYPLKEYAVFQFYKSIFSTPCVPPNQLLIIKNLPILSQDSRLVFSKSNISKNHNNRPIEELITLDPIVRTILESKLEKENYFIQASTFIQGDIIYRFFDEYNCKPLDYNSCKSRLDLNSFSTHILSSLLLIPMDFKLDYLVIENGSNKIYSIENDRSFESEIKINQKIKDDWMLGTRNVLYTIEPLMLEPVSSKVSDEFLSIQPNILILKWLFSMYEKEELYLKLINLFLPPSTTNNDLEKSLRNLKNNLHLPQTFNQGWISLLVNRFKLIRDQLIINKQSTHQQLFELVHPIASSFYKLISEKFKDNRLEQIKYIFKSYSLKNLLKSDFEVKEIEKIIKDNNMIPSVEPKKLSIIETIQELISITRFDQFNPINDDIGQWVDIVSQIKNNIPKDKKTLIKLHSSWNKININ